MPWTPQDLKAALVGMDPATDRVAILNAQTTEMVAQSFPWSDAKGVARGSETLDWSRIIARARMTPNLPPANPADYAILVAISATECEDGQMFDPTNERRWAAFMTGMNILLAVGDLSQDSVERIAALGTKTVPVWDPPVTAGDIQTAEAQP